MAVKLYDDAEIKDIADAIREKNGTTNVYTVAQMGNAVRELDSGGGGPGIEAVVVTFEPTSAPPPRMVCYTTADGTIGQYTYVSATSFTLSVAKNTIIAAYNISTNLPVAITPTDNYLVGKVTGAKVITAQETIQLA